MKDYRDSKLLDNRHGTLFCSRESNSEGAPTHPKVTTYAPARELVIKFDRLSIQKKLFRIQYKRVIKNHIGLVSLQNSLGEV